MHNVTDYEAKTVEWASQSTNWQKDVRREGKAPVDTGVTMEELAGRFEDALTKL